MNKWLIPSLILVLLLAFGCKKKNKDSVTFSGNITEMIPTANDTLHGNPLHVQATAVASKELHGWYYVVYNAETLDVLHENQAHVHGTTLTLDEQVTLSLSDTTILKVEVEFATESADEHISKEILCTWIP